MKWLRTTLGFGVVLGVVLAAQADDKPAPRPRTDFFSKKLAQVIDFKLSLTTADGTEQTFPLADPQKDAGPKVRPGQSFRLTVTGQPKPGYHTYPIVTLAAGQSNTSRIEYENAAALKPLPPLTESRPELVKEVTGEMVNEFAHEFTWKQDFLVLRDAAAGPKTLEVSIRVQVCDDKGCIGPGLYPPLSAQINVEGEPVAYTAELADRLQQAETAPPTAVTKPVPAVDDPAKGGLWGLMLASALAAIGMLLTPCVFPMIPITVSFFLKQSEREHHKPFLTAGVYSLTIIVVLTLAVLVLGSVIIDLANNMWMNLGLGLVLIFFALSLFGMYEIELPSFLAAFTSARESKGGYAGAFFMALTFTITSFTCTGPFLGPLLASFAVTQKASFAELALSALTYSATFAAPFFVLALFPRLLKTLPKSGGWLNSVKVVMGFLELAAALKFLGNFDLALNPGRPMFFGYETVLCSWIAISVACGLYLLGLFRLPHDSPVEHVGVVRMILATIFLGLALYMAPALWRETPEGLIGRGVVAFLPLDSKHNPHELHWTKDYQAAYEEAVAEGKPIFIDFTGVNCTNCRYNEKTVFTQPAVRKELEGFVRVQLYTDEVPDPSLTSAESIRQAERNRNWLYWTYGDLTNPFYAIIVPAKNQPIVVQDGEGVEKLNGARKEMTRSGLIPEAKIKEFEQFLRQGRRMGTATASKPTLAAGEVAQANRE